MEIISSNMLKRFLDQDKRKFEGILPELIKKLILSSSPDLKYIRIPGRDDIWAPGFDGVVDNVEQTKYVSGGISVWECGTNSDSLSILEQCYCLTHVLTKVPNIFTKAPSRSNQDACTRPSERTYSMQCCRQITNTI